MTQKEVAEHLIKLGFKANRSKTIFTKEDKEGIEFHKIITCDTFNPAHIKVQWKFKPEIFDSMKKFATVFDGTIYSQTALEIILNATNVIE